MKTGVELGYVEVRALRSLIWIARVHRDLSDELGPEILTRADTALAGAERALLCRHCAGGPQRATEGLCAACAAYKHRTGELPSEEILEARDAL